MFRATWLSRYTPSRLGGGPEASTPNAKASPLLLKARPEARRDLRPLSPKTVGKLHLKCRRREEFGLELCRNRNTLSWSGRPDQYKVGDIPLGCPPGRPAAFCLPELGWRPGFPQQARPLPGAGSTFRLVGWFLGFWLFLVLAGWGSDSVGCDLFPSPRPREAPDALESC